MTLTIAERLLKLVQIDSVIGSEQAICDYVMATWGALPAYHATRVDNSIALYPKQRQRDKLVALIGHLDTVPPSGDNPPRIVGGRVHGLGSADMKSGLAVMERLLLDPVANSPYDLAYIFYHGEEGPYLESGLGPLLEQLDWRNQIDLGFCLEPSDNVLQLGCLGTLHAEVTFKGQAAHSARPWQGDNAIHKAASLLNKLAARQPIDVRFGDLLYREVISATIAGGGTAKNVIPAAFSINLNYRFAPGRSSQSACDQIIELVDGDADVEFKDIAPSGRVPEDNPVLQAFRATTQVDVAAKQAWTDVGRFSELGIDAVNWGPGEGAQCHQPTESTAIDLLERGEALFRKFLAG